jgi:hypothetical protein
MASFRSRGRKCKFESLENRRMAAGNVTTNVTHGNLIVKGDNHDNAIVITAGPLPFDVNVTGVNDNNGNPTSVDGVPNGTTTVHNIIHGLKVDMAAGNDNVTVRDVTINGKTTIKTGKGADSVTVGRADVSTNFNSSLKIKTGKDADTVIVRNTTVLGKASIKTNGAHDAVTITTSQVGKLRVGLGSGNDTLAITTTNVIVNTKLAGNKGIDLYTNGPNNFYGNNVIHTSLNGGWGG